MGTWKGKKISHFEKGCVHLGLLFVEVEAAYMCVATGTTSVLKSEWLYREPPGGVCAAHPPVCCLVTGVPGLLTNPVQFLCSLWWPCLNDWSFLFSALCCSAFYSVLFLGAAFVLGCQGVGQTDLCELKLWIHVCFKSTLEC